MNSALLVIDMINDFLLPGAPLEVPMGGEIIPRIKEEIKAFHSSGNLIIFVSDSHSPNDKEFDYWPEHAIYHKRGARIIDAFQCDSEIGQIVREYATKIGKHTYSAFFVTGLNEHLRRYGITTVKITGILTNICVFITAVEAQIRGYETFVYRDSVAALTQKDNDRALEQLEKVFKITIL